MLILLKYFIVVGVFVLNEAQGASSLLRGRLLYPPTTESLAAEATALKQRKISEVLLFKLINSIDNSEHWLFATVSAGVDLSKNFPADSRLLVALREATTVLSESISDENISSQLRDKFAERKAMVEAVSEGFDLQEQLGEDYWSALRQMVREHPAIGDDVASRYRAARKLKQGHPALTIDLLTDDILLAVLEETTGGLQAQVDAVAAAQGKKVIALASAEQELDAVLNYYVNVRATATIDDVKEIIDRGGYRHIMESNLTMLDAYFAGDAEELVHTYRNASTRLLREKDTIMVEERNRTWLANGSIQTHCRAGEVCLLSADFKHLFGVENNLIKLLQQEGYVVERLSSSVF